MINYIEYLNMPAKAAIVIVGLFLVMQVIGEFLEFKGKVVPEFAKVRKIFARRKRERQIIQDVSVTLDEVKKSLDEINAHYSADNITMRDKWMKLVNDKLEQYDGSLAELSHKLDKNSQDTLSILIENKRSVIIGFAELVIDESKPVTREQFNRVFKMYQDYEGIISENGLTNGEVDVAIQIIKDAYESHMRNHSFIEDVRGYTTHAESVC